MRVLFKIRYIAFSVSLLTIVHLNAQIKNISINKEVRIDNLYAGLLSYSKLTGEKDLWNASSIQMGTRVRLELIPKKVFIRTFGVFKTSEGKETQFFKSYEGILTINKKASIHVGVMATPTTELRPNPTTWESQVETNSEKNILGGRKGLKINYEFSPQLKVSYGFHQHERANAHHLKITHKELNVAVYREENQLFTAIKWKYSKGNLVFTRFNKNTSLSAIVPISTNYKFYVDMEHNDLSRNLNYLELGARRSFCKNRLFKGFVSLSYNHNIQGFEGGLFLHL